MTDTPETRPLPIGSQRMPSIPPEGWTDEIRELFAVYEGEEGRKNGSRYNFTHWFANHPELATNWMRYNHALSRGEMDPRLREIVVMRVSHRYQSDYEWNLHVQISAALGFGEAEFSAIKEGPDAALFTDKERICLQATDALIDHHDIDDALWAKIAANLNRKEQMELLFMVGSYTLLAWVLKTVRMPLEDLKT
jgi:4-carboxymuconolactone decarboxylase